VYYGAIIPPRVRGTFLSGSAVLLPLVLALVSAPVAAFSGVSRPAFAAPVGAAFAALAFGATLWGWLSGGGAVDLAWAPSWDLRLHLELDGLATLYALLATGIGFVIIVYSSLYLPLHLEHQNRPASDGTGFYFFMLLFMGSMVGLAMAQDLILIFVFWDLTAIASYYLIGFDRHDPDSRASALMALIVTGVTAVLLLIGALLLYTAHGTFSVPELVGRVEPGTLLTVSGALFAVAGLAKSAQVPLHFWLPRAMAAPTPVSAYLHSAAMVAAGVLLIGRLYPLLQKSEVLLDALLVVGFASMALGGTIALTRDVLKQLLAYSTISQYGYVVVMYGLGGEYGAVGAAFYVLAHALCKSALFLTAGTVTETTGEDQLSRLGGLRRSIPLLAVGSGLAAAGLASLPLTIGFFKDELFFAAALERGPAFAALAVLGAALTFAYTWRFWNGIFEGDPGPGAERASGILVWPVVALGGLVVLVGGSSAEPYLGLALAAGSDSLGASATVSAAYHLDARPENLMALATYGLGVLLMAARPLWSGAALAFSRLGEKIGPERLYGLGLRGLNRLSDWVHRAEVRDLRSRVAAILLPAGILVGTGLLVTPTGGTYRLEEIRPQDVPLLLALVPVAVAALTTTFTKRHVTLALVLSSAGFTLALAFAFLGAPDVALVAVLIETVLTLLFLGTLRLVPHKVLHRQATLPTERRWRKVFFAVVAGAFAFAVVWGTLSRPAAERSVSEVHLRLTPEAHAKDVVTAILTDFRGLDTLGEISVVALVLLAVVTLLRGRTLR
jgi:multicomponent Na+:H+ antiporter subunit A